MPALLDSPFPLVFFPKEGVIWLPRSSVITPWLPERPACIPSLERGNEPEHPLEKALQDQGYNASEGGTQHPFDETKLAVHTQLESLDVLPGCQLRLTGSLLNASATASAWTSGMLESLRRRTNFRVSKVVLAIFQRVPDGFQTAEIIRVGSMFRQWIHTDSRVLGRPRVAPSPSTGCRKRHGSSPFNPL